MSIKQAIEALEALLGDPGPDYIKSSAWDKATTALAALRSMPAEPVATLWQHGETGRTRVVMPDMIVDTDASWQLVGPLCLGATPHTAPKVVSSNLPVVSTAVLSDETIRLAKVALHEMPRPSTDWHEAAKRVCTAVAALAGEAKE